MNHFSKLAGVFGILVLSACGGGGMTGSSPTTSSAGSAAGTTSVVGTAAQQTQARTDLSINTSSATWQSLDSQTVQPTGNDLAAFAFSTNNNNRLLVTQTDPSKNLLLGDHYLGTITANVAISGVTTGATFTYAEPTCGSTPATVRLFFTSTGGPFAYTDYWWSDVASATLASILSGTTPTTLTAILDPTTAWSDWNGQPSSGTNTAAFTAAASNITSIGLSFGGGCFFENGVGTSDGSGIFTLQSFTD